MAQLHTTCNGNGGSHYHLYLDYSCDAPDVANNRTYIYLTLWAQSDSTSYGAYNLNSGSNSYYLQINGSNVASGTKAMDFRNKAVVSLGSYQGYVNHNSDGSLTITIGGGFSISGSSYLTGGSISGSWTLPTIPRASSITTFDNFDIGNNITIGLDIKASFSHVLTLKIGSTTVATRTGITASPYTLILSIAEQDIIYNSIPNSTTVTVTLECVTYNGETTIGSSSKSAMASVGASIVPTFSSLSAAETIANVNTIVGRFVQNLSRIKFDINGAAAIKGASISSYEINIDGKVYVGSSVTSEVINKAGDITVIGKVTDSRGRSFSRQITVNLLAYITPNIILFSVERCNSDGTNNAVGTYAKVNAAGSVQSLLNTTERNTLTYKIYSKVRGTADWGTAKKNLTISGLSLNTSDVIGDGTTVIYDAASSYDFRIDIVDKFNTTLSLIVLSTGQVPISIGRTGIGVGKIFEKGTLDVAGDIYSSGRIYQGSTTDNPVWGAEDLALSAGGINFEVSFEDFNNVYKTGFYRGTNMANSPLGHSDWWFFIIVQNHDGGWVSQIAISYFENKIFFRRTNGTLTTWQAWEEVWITSSSTYAQTTTGYMRLPNGFMIQWGNSTVPSGGGTILFPLAFPNACYMVTTSLNNHSAWNTPANWDKNQVTFFHGAGASIGVLWIAIGS